MKASKKTYREAGRVRKALEAFFTAAADDDVDALKRYLESAQQANDEVSESEVLLDTLDAHDRTALHFAANAGGEECVEYILEACPEAAQAVDEDGATPLHLAVTGRQRSCAEMILEAGADVNRGDSSGVRPVHHAAGLGSVKLLELLIAAGADLTLMSGAGTPLHWAAGNGHLDAVRCLLDEGAACDSQNAQGVTPAIMAAARGGNGDIVALLVEKGADTGLVLGGNLTMLHICADMGSEEAVRSILASEHGAKCAAHANDDGQRPIDMAAVSGHTAVVGLLLPHSGVADGETAESFVERAREAHALRAADIEAAPTLPAAVETASVDMPPEPTTAAEDEGKAKEAMELKNEANRDFVRKQYDAALDKYTRALLLDGSQPTFWSNRSACQLARGKPRLALADAMVARGLDPEWTKAIYRVGQAQLELGLFEEAAVTAWEGVKMDNTSEPLKRLLKDAVAKGRQAHHSGGAEATQDSQDAQDAS